MYQIRSHLYTPIVTKAEPAPRATRVLRLKAPTFGGYRGYGDTFYIDEVLAGVPDHSDQRQAALSVAGC